MLGFQYERVTCDYPFGGGKQRMDWMEGMGSGGGMVVLVVVAVVLLWWCWCWREKA